jgi:hypothetical protein
MLNTATPAETNIKLPHERYYNPVKNPNFEGFFALEGELKQYEQQHANYC